MSDEKQTVILIDFSALFRRAWHVQSDVSHAYEATIGGVNRASAMVPDSLVAVCCDGRGNWRKELSKEYKANREAQPAALYGEMDRTIDRLKKDGRLIWKFDGFEADDVIGTATGMARSRGHSVRIVSHDKDMLQLLGPGVDYVAIHMTPWEVKTHLDVVEKYGIETTQFADWLAIAGDTSDTVKGCPGVGKEAATALLFKYETVDGIRAALHIKCVRCKGATKIINDNQREVKCPDCKGTGDKYDEWLGPSARKNLEKFLAPSGDFELFRKLVSLSHDVPIRFDEIYETREIDANQGDKMSEAEADADKFFGASLKDATKEESPGPGITEKTQPETNGSILTEQVSDRDLKQPSTSPAASVISVRDKTPEEIEEASRPIETSLAVVEYSRQLEPRSMRDAHVYADLMFHSGIYSRYPTKQSILAAIVRGRELGFGAGASLDMFHVADFNRDGKLRLLLHAHLIIDLAMKDPGLEYFMLVESDCEHATYAAKVRRNPIQTTITYTIEDARTANLVKPGSNWEKRPTEQLRKTSGVQLARVVSPGRTLGLYCFEEMGIDE